MLRLLASLCLAFACAAAQAADTSFVSAVTLSGTTYNTASGVGMQFTNTSGASVVITQLGRWVVSGNSQSHTIGIYTTTSFSSPVASVSVNTSGATTGQFLYGTLGTPYTLADGASVWIISGETVSGDIWYGNNGVPASNILTVTDIGTCQSAYVNGGGSTINPGGNNGGTYTAFGPVSFKYSAPVPNWTKNGSVYTTDGSQYSVRSAIGNATAGDTVNVPAGSFTWYGVTIDKAITVQGAGAASTTINIGPTSPTYSSGGAVTITAAAVFGNLTMTQPGTGNTTAIKATTTSGWRIHGITYNSAATVGYFVYADTLSGLIDTCTINGGAGNDEWIFTRGPTDAWQTASTLGTAGAVYVEDCIFNLQGYTDFNANARAVVRFCTINPSLNYIKIDGHGYATNSPAYSFRTIEVYNNTWTANANNNLAIEIRGGSGIIFGNTTGNTPAFYLTDYGYLTNLTNYGVYQTPADYPLIDQVGVGMDPKVAHSEPAYVFNNKMSGGSAAWARTLKTPAPGAIALYGSTFTEPDIIQSNRDFFSDAGFDTNTGASIGTTAAMNALTPSVTGYGFWVTDQGSWNTTIAPGTSGQLYRWTGSAWALYYTPYTYPHPLRSGVLSPNPSTIASTSAAATQITVVATTTTGGVGAISYNHAINGTYAGWQASPSHTFTGLTPSTSYAFKVEAQDNATTTTESSVSNVSTTGTVPTVSSVAIPSAGTTTVLTLSASCTTGTGGIGGITASASGGALTLTYSSGSGSGTYTFTNSRTVLSTETVTLTYAQPGNGIEATTGGADLASFSGRAVTNNSTQVAATVPTVSLITIPAAGTTTVLTLSQSATVGAGGSGGFTAVASGGALTLTYASGSPGTAYTLTNSRTVNAGETVQVTYVQPGNGIEGTTGGLDLASFSLRSVANGSTAGIPTTTPTPPAPDRQPKPKKKR